MKIITTTHEPKSITKLTVEIPSEELLVFKSQVLEALQKTTELDGFRKGKAPLSVIEQHIGDVALYEKMAFEALISGYPELLKEASLDAIGQPRIVFTKLVPGEHVEVLLEIATLPKITLAEYKKIAHTHMHGAVSEPVTDEELARAVREIRQIRTHQKMHTDNIPHESHDHQHLTDEELIAYDDAFVGTLGAFTTIAEFETKLRENMQAEKDAKARDARIMKILEDILAESTCDIPDLLTEYEQIKMLQQFEADIAQAGMSFEDYLKRINKSRADLLAEWYEPARKRAQMNMLIDEIARTEKLEPDTEAVTAEVEKITAQFKDHKDFSPDRAREYVHGILTNQKVFEFLEAQK